MDNDSFALELLAEIKAQSKRWFIAFIVMLIVEILTIGICFWYCSLPIETYTIEQESDDASINQIVGGDFNGNETESNPY